MHYLSKIYLKKFLLRINFIVRKINSPKSADFHSLAVRWSSYMRSNTFFVSSAVVAFKFPNVLTFHNFHKHLLCSCRLLCYILSIWTLSLNGNIVQSRLLLWSFYRKWSVKCVFIGWAVKQNGQCSNIPAIWFTPTVLGQCPARSVSRDQIFKAGLSILSSIENVRGYHNMLCSTFAGITRVQTK